MAQVFIGPDAEALQPEALAVTDWEAAVIRPVPSLLVLPITTNADAIWQALARGDRVELRGFGAFSVKNRPARTGRNPRTKEEIVIDAAKVPKFKAGKALKDAVN